jgi:hypothetical protein
MKATVCIAVQGSTTIVVHCVAHTCLVSSVGVYWLIGSQAATSDSLSLSTAAVLFGQWRVQDLRRARLVLWADDPAALITNDTAPFFDAFSQHVTIKRFDYDKVNKCSSVLGVASHGSCGL